MRRAEQPIQRHTKCQLCTGKRLQQLVRSRTEDKRARERTHSAHAVVACAAVRPSPTPQRSHHRWRAHLAAAVAVGAASPRWPQKCRTAAGEPWRVGIGRLTPPPSPYSLTPASRSRCDSTCGERSGCSPNTCMSVACRWCWLQQERTHAGERQLARQRSSAQRHGGGAEGSGGALANVR